MRKYTPFRCDARNALVLLIILVSMIPEQYGLEPSFAIHIPKITVVAGNDVSLPCVVNDLGKHKLAWINIDKYILLTLHLRPITRDKRFSIAYGNYQTWWLNIKDVQESDKGNYVCQINTKTMISQRTYLEVVNASQNGWNPSFAEPIPNTKITAGRDVKLPCVVKDLGDYMLMWVHKDKHRLLTIRERLITRDSRYSVTYDGCQTWWLNIKNVQESDKGEYVCKINSAPIISQSGNLEVQGYVQDDPEHFTANLGEDVILRCAFEFPENKPVPYLIQWQKQGIKTPIYVWYDGYPPHAGDGYEGRVSHAHQASLNLTNVHKSDQGWYECKVYFANRPTEERPKNGTWVHLDVLDALQNGLKPSFAEHIPNVAVEAGEDVSLPCVVNDLGNYKLAWIRIDKHQVLTFHEQKIAKDDRYSVTYGHSQTYWLNITDVQESDKGNYMCYINTTPMITQITHLEVLHPSDSYVRILSLLMPRRPFKGDDAILTCEFDLGLEDLYSVTWYKDDDEFLQYVPSDEPPLLYFPPRGLDLDFSRSDKSHVYLRNLSLENSGNYRCEVSTGAPYFTVVQNTHRMDVIVPFNISSLYVPSRVLAGKNATLWCEYDLGGETSYAVKWYKDYEEFFRYTPTSDPSLMEFRVVGVNLDISRSNAVVELLNLNTNSSGNYTCEVRSDKPYFRIKRMTKHMEVVDEASEDVNIQPWT